MTLLLGRPVDARCALDAAGQIGAGRAHGGGECAKRRRRSSGVCALQRPRAGAPQARLSALTHGAGAGTDSIAIVVAASEAFVALVPVCGPAAFTLALVESRHPTRTLHAQVRALARSIERAGAARCHRADGLASAATAHGAFGAGIGARLSRLRKAHASAFGRACCILLARRRHAALCTHRGDGIEGLADLAGSGFVAVGAGGASARARAAQADDFTGLAGSRPRCAATSATGGSRRADVERVAGLFVRNALDAVTTPRFGRADATSAGGALQACEACGPELRCPSACGRVDVSPKLNAQGLLLRRLAPGCAVQLGAAVQVRYRGATARGRSEGFAQPGLGIIGHAGHWRASVATSALLRDRLDHSGAGAPKRAGRLAGRRGGAATGESGGNACAEGEGCDGSKRRGGHAAADATFVPSGRPQRLSAVTSSAGAAVTSRQAEVTGCRHAPLAGARAASTGAGALWLRCRPRRRGHRDSRECLRTLALTCHARGTTLSPRKDLVRSSRRGRSPRVSVTSGWTGRHGRPLRPRGRYARLGSLFQGTATPRRLSILVRPKRESPRSSAARV